MLCTYQRHFPFGFIAITADYESMGNLSGTGAAFMSSCTITLSNFGQVRSIVMKGKKNI